MRIIGTDVSLDTCKDEGYLMMKYDARRPYNHDREVMFEEYLPDYVREKMLATRRDHGMKWTRCNTRDLWNDYYELHQNSIDSCCDCHYNSLEDIDSYNALLMFADNINAYMGIFD